MYSEVEVVMSLQKLYQDIEKKWKGFSYSISYIPPGDTNKPTGGFIELNICPPVSVNYIEMTTVITKDGIAFE